MPHNAEPAYSLPAMPAAAPGLPAAVVAPPPPPPAAPAAPSPPSVQVAMAAPALVDPGRGFAGPPPPAAPKQEPKGVAKLIARFRKKDQGSSDPNATQAVERQPQQALPTRTWILLAVTVLVTVGWLLWDDTPEP